MVFSMSTLRSGIRLANAAQSMFGPQAAGSSKFIAARVVGIAAQRASVTTSSKTGQEVAVAAKPPHSAESFLDGSSGPYVEEMYRAWKQDPKSVHVSWASYFRNVEAGLAPASAVQTPPALQTSAHVRDTAESDVMRLPHAGTLTSDEIKKYIGVSMLIRAYQVRGHLKADIDPLGIGHPAQFHMETPKELDYRTYGLTEADLKEEFVFGIPDNSGFLGDATPRPLGEIIDNLNKTYCGHIGVEYMHIGDKNQCNWIRERLEVPEPYKYSVDDRRMIFRRMVKGHGFEAFLANKFSAEKRFGLEGCETLIPGMRALVDRCGQAGMTNLVFGMPHRGRLNVLNNVLRKPLELLFAEFKSDMEPDEEGSGDVKYHLGMSTDITTKDGNQLHLSLVANPSHLEAVNPVVEGKTRAEQFYKKDFERKRCMSVLLHGDAAFSGQGVVYETLGLADLPHYATGGTIHMVVNNQIGFTTDPRFSRSSPYCTDVAKAVGAPIFHVNADDPEAVTYISELAVDYRQQFGKDVVIDLVCYRRHGHNEIDQPAFTQPLMYKKIRSHAPTLDIYKERLLKEGVMTKEEQEKEITGYNEMCRMAYDRSKTQKIKISEWLESKWEGFKSKKQLARIRNTGVPLDTLRQVGMKFSSYPQDFSIHNGLRRILEARKRTIEAGEGLDWATCEALAFGTLLLEGNHVRLSGQDVERGTFSQRHHVLHDQKNESLYCALSDLSDDQAQYTVSNSSLSEYAVLGFELGYSMTNPNSLVCWEAQFGDFVNGAQIIIDQFISCGEAKWLRQSGLTMLLPHGYEGMGPEHSSARMERFLQQCDEDPDVIPDMHHNTRAQIQNSNWQIVNCSSPANYYHVLRRQVHRDFRKPLVVFTPKSLLRHPLAKSKLSDMTEGTRFRRVIHEEEVGASPDVKRLIFCSGKVYYDLYKQRQEKGIKDIAIARLEQISPFPFDLIAKQANDYPNAEIWWCQEEPKNQGAWAYVRPRFNTALRESESHGGVEVKYAGRAPAAATATGNKRTHVAEERALLSQALDLK
eukprot:Clim_evm47s243 gene=Clim_evmTU47s243